MKASMREEKPADAVIAPYHARINEIRYETKTTP
jgi:hypothetical protein